MTPQDKESWSSLARETQGGLWARFRFSLLSRSLCCVALAARSSPGGVMPHAHCGEAGRFTRFHRIQGQASTHLDGAQLPNPCVPPRGSSSIVLSGCWSTAVAPRPRALRTRRGRKSQTTDRSRRPARRAAAGRPDSGASRPRRARYDYSRDPGAAGPPRPAVLCRRAYGEGGDPPAQCARQNRRYAPFLAAAEAAFAVASATESHSTATGCRRECWRNWS